MSLLDRYIDPDLIKQLPWSEKVLATFYVIVAGMLITFAILVIVWIFVILLSRIFGSRKSQGEAMSPHTNPPPPLRSTLEEDSELVAVITAALSSSLQVSPDTIRVRNIVRMTDPTPSWVRMGRIEQFNQEKG